jgi:hypothetical protein
VHGLVAREGRQEARGRHIRPEIVEKRPDPLEGAQNPLQSELLREEELLPPDGDQLQLRRRGCLDRMEGGLGRAVCLEDGEDALVDGAELRDDGVLPLVHRGVRLGRVKWV